MRIGPQPKLISSSSYYNLQSLEDTIVYSKSYSPMNKCHSHFGTSLLNSKIEIKETLQNMDILYSSNFLEFIQDEQCHDKIGFSLSNICADFPMHNIVLVVEFIIERWELLSVSKLLVSLTYDWHPDYSGKFMNLLTAKYDEAAKIRLCVFMLYDEDAETAALFLSSCMATWNIMQKSTFIQFLENCLNWGVEFLDEFLFYYLHHLRLKCLDEGFDKVMDTYKLSPLPCIKRLKRIFSFPFILDDNNIYDNTTVELELKLFLTISIHKSKIDVVIDSEDIEENKKLKENVNLIRHPTLVSISSRLTLSDIEEDTSDSCNDEPRSFFRQLLDRLRN